MKKKNTLILFLLLVLFCGWKHEMIAQQVQRLTIDKITQTGSVQETAKPAFVLSGKKLYEVGLINGTYPNNDPAYIERGIWSHPLKLLNSIHFSIINETDKWNLTNAQEFNYHFHSADMTFRQKDIEVERQNFIVEEEIAYFSKIKIRNLLPIERKIVLRLSADIHIAPSARTVTLKDTPDEISIKEEVIMAKDSLGCLVLGADKSMKCWEIKDSLVWIDYELILPPLEKNEIVFLLTGSHTIKENKYTAYELYKRLLPTYNAQLALKQTYYNDLIFNGVQFSCSDKKITDAFYCAKANVLLNIKDHRPYLKMPFIGAGIPVYPRLFGTDFCFSVPGLMASGFKDIVRSTLINLMKYTKENWRAPHEVASDGVLLGWDHIQIAPQLVTACWEHFLWTRDTLFLQKTYPLCIQLMQDVMTKADNDSDGFLEGHGLMEESKFKGDWEELSAASYLYPALKDLSMMAHIFNDKKKEKGYTKKAEHYKRHFNKQWWNSQENIWACAIDKENNPKMYNFWSVIFPLKTKVANNKNGEKAIKNIKTNWINNQWGMIGRYWPGRDMSQEGVGLVHNNICSTTAFDYGETDLGWKLIDLTAKGVFDLPNSLLGLFPECQPHLCTNITQLWSYAPFLESLLKGFMGVTPGEKGINIRPAFPNHISFAELREMSIGKEKLSVNWEKNKNGNINLQVTYTGQLNQIHIHIPPSLKGKIQTTIKKMEKP